MDKKKCQDELPNRNLRLCQVVKSSPNPIPVYLNHGFDYSKPN